jgi:hypothetical protein
MFLNMAQIKKAEIKFQIILTFFNKSVRDSLALEIKFAVFWEIPCLIVLSQISGLI